MAVSDTCDGAWFKQINTSFKITGDRIGYDCTYENNAFFLRVRCPEKDPDYTGPGCRSYCQEYDISWEQYSDPDGNRVWLPLINGTPYDPSGDIIPTDPAGGVSINFELYQGCIHKIYQRDSSNAIEEFSRCITIRDAEGNPIDLDSIGYGCPDNLDCTTGINRGCGCEDDNCDLVFGRDMVIEVSPSVPPEGLENKQQKVFITFDGLGEIEPGPDDENEYEVPRDIVTKGIPAIVTWNSLKNPNTTLDGLRDYQWYHLPINENKPNPSGAFGRSENPDCCRCCGSELTTQEGGGLICTRADDRVSGAPDTNSPTCTFTIKPSEGEGLADPACGRVCPEGFFCCPLTGQCLPIIGLPSSTDDPPERIYCKGCPIPCEEGESCCISQVPGSNPPIYAPQCVEGECDVDFEPHGEYAINIGDACPPNCEFSINTPIVVIGELV